MISRYFFFKLSCPLKGHDIALLLFQIKIQTKMSGGRRRGRIAAGADEDDKEDPSVSQKKGKSVATKKGKKM
jgi:hypothetical protein